MILRSGEHTRMLELANLMEMVKAIMEEKKGHQELVVERRERDQQLTEKRRQREEQMQVLLRLVEGVTRGPEEAENRRVSRGTDRDSGKATVWIKKQSEDDDVEVYLTTFERLMSAHGIKKARWSFELAPNLTGWAQQEYAPLEANVASNYETLKAEIPNSYNTPARALSHIHTK